MSLRLLMLCIAVPFAALAAESSQPSSPRAAAAAPVSEAKAKQAQAAPVETGHAYLPAQKRDPFRETPVVLPPPASHCGTLCTYDLEQLKIVALVTGISTPLAGLEAPNGTVYVVDRGTRVGRRGGRVVEVSKARLVIEEPCSKPGGKCRTVLDLDDRPLPDGPSAPRDENLLRP